MRDDRPRDQRLCRNFLCLIAELDMHELVDAGVVTAASWPAFRDDPAHAYLRLGDDREAKCFSLIRARMPADLWAAGSAV